MLSEFNLENLIRFVLFAVLSYGICKFVFIKPIQSALTEVWWNQTCQRCTVLDDASSR